MLLYFQPSASHALYLWCWYNKQSPALRSLLVYLCAQVRSSVAVLCFAPLNLVPFILSEENPIQYLGALGLVMALVQYFSMKHVKHVNMKVI